MIYGSPLKICVVRPIFDSAFNESMAHFGKTNALGEIMMLMINVGGASVISDIPQQLISTSGFLSMSSAE